MLKKLRGKLLKIGAVKRAVANYRKRLKWAKVIHTGGNVRDLRAKELDVFMVVADGGMYEGMRGGKVVRRGLINVRNWGGMK